MSLVEQLTAISTAGLVRPMADAQYVTILAEARREASLHASALDLIKTLEARNTTLEAELAAARGTTPTPAPAPVPPPAGGGALPAFLHADDLDHPILFGFGNYFKEGGQLDWYRPREDGLEMYFAAGRKTSDGKAILRTEMGLFNTSKEPSVIRNEPFRKRRVYRIAVRIPADWERLDSKVNLFQFWPDPDTDAEGSIGRNPILALQLWGDNLKLAQVVSGVKIQTSNPTPADLFVEPFQRGAWYDYTIESFWSHLNDGLLRIWRNNTKVVDRAGKPNADNDDNGAKFKWGPYWPNSVNAASGFDFALLYSKLRIAGENVSVDDVMRS